jgi:hypothetical protein
MDEEAKSVATKALRLPQSIKHPAEDSEPEGNLAFSPEVVEKIHQARFGASVLRNTSNFYKGRGFNDARGQHYRGRSSYFQSSSRGNPFLKASTATKRRDNRGQDTMMKLNLQRKECDAAIQH